jgi:hypothetical protein
MAVQRTLAQMRSPCPSPVCQNITYGAAELVDASYDRRRNDQGLSAMAIVSRGDRSRPWQHPWKRHDSWKHHAGGWPSRKRDRRSMRLSIATGARTHGPKISGCSEPEHAMNFRTKISRTSILRTNISPSQADRAAIFRLSWHGFLVCAFAVMTFLAWATLRQALGAEPNATGPQLTGETSRAPFPLRMETAPSGAEIVNAN